MKTSNNRAKGHKAERFYANEFREMGWDKCVTSRYGSRQHDDAGIDLINIPFNVQIKAGIHKGMRPDKVIGYTEMRVSEIFKNGPERWNPIILIHQRKGGKIRGKNEMVYMAYHDYITIIKEYVLNNKKTKNSVNRIKTTKAKDQEEWGFHVRKEHDTIDPENGITSKRWYAPRQKDRDTFQRDCIVVMTFEEFKEKINHKKNKKKYENTDKDSQQK